MELLPIEDWGDSDSHEQRASLLERFGSRGYGGWWSPQRIYRDVYGTYYSYYRGGLVGGGGEDPRGGLGLGSGWRPLLKLVAVLVLVQLLFALNAVVSGEVVRSADPVIFSFLRDAGGSAVLLFAASASPEGLVWPQLKDLWAFAAIGVGGVYLGQLFLLIAMTYISAFNAMVLDALIPVFTLLLGHAFGVERLRLWADSPRHRRQVAATLLTVAGAVVVVAAQAQQQASSLPIEEASASASSSAASVSSSANAVGKAAPTALLSDFVVGNLFALTFAIGGSTYPLLQKHVMATTRMPPLSVAAFG